MYKYNTAALLTKTHWYTYSITNQYDNTDQIFIQLQLHTNEAYQFCDSTLSVVFLYARKWH